MTKFRCIKGSVAVPVGTIIVGELEEGKITITETSKLLDRKGKPYFYVGEQLPLTGYVWQWETCEGELDKAELLKRLS